MLQIGFIAVLLILTVGLHLKHIHYGKANLGDAEIIGMAVPDFLAAVATGILVIPDMGIPHADFPFEVPVARKRVLVAIGETRACKRALVAVVPGCLIELYAAEEKTGHRDIDVGNVELTPHGMHAYEVAVEARASPPPVFRHEHPMLGIPLAMAVGTEFPRVYAIDKVDSGFPPHADLYAEVRSGGCIVKKICFYRHLL